MKVHFVARCILVSLACLLGACPNPDRRADEGLKVLDLRERLVSASAWRGDGPVPAWVIENPATGWSVGVGEAMHLEEAIQLARLDAVRTLIESKSVRIASVTEVEAEAGEFGVRRSLRAHIVAAAQEVDLKFSEHSRYWQERQEAWQNSQREKSYRDRVRCWVRIARDG